MVYSSSHLPASNGQAKAFLLGFWRSSTCAQATTLDIAATGPAPLRLHPSEYSHACYIVLVQTFRCSEHLRHLIDLLFI